MSKPTYVEAFPQFQALGRGVPFLAIWKNRETAPSTVTKDRSETTQSSKSTAKR